MPPHCDTLDGPVVIAAKKALETGNINWLLPWIYEGGEDEIRHAFQKVLEVRKSNVAAAIELADLWLFETAVRVHREGEGAPYTGLKPAGLDNGPLIPRVERSLVKGNPQEIIEYLNHQVELAVTERFKKIIERKEYDVNDVPAARAYVQAFLGLTLFSHHLYLWIKSGGDHQEDHDSKEEFDEPVKPASERKQDTHTHHHE
jgi:hypothetical protein